VNVVSGVPSSQYLSSTTDEEEEDDSFDYDVCNYDICYSFCDDDDGCENDVDDAVSSDSSTIGNCWSDDDQFPSSKAFPTSSHNVSDGDDGDFGLSTLFDLSESSNDGTDHATDEEKQKARNSNSRSV